MAIRGELYTTQVTLDNRSYFFNVKENRNGDVFLQVVESKISQGEDERRAIVIFADDMQKFLSGMEDSLSFIEKDRKEKAKIRAEKKAAKEAKYGHGGTGDNSKSNGGKKIIRRKGESRLVAERRAEREEEKARNEAAEKERVESGVKRTGKVIHVVSKRSSDN